MKYLKTYEKLNDHKIVAGKYITFPYDIDIDNDYKIYAFVPYEIIDVCDNDFSIYYYNNFKIYIYKDDKDIIFLPDDFDDEYLNTLEKTYKYNL